MFSLCYSVCLFTIEPLYQHIRNAEFGFNPPASSINDNSPLEVARRGTLRLRTKLWSQQTKVPPVWCGVVCVQCACTLWCEQDLLK